MSCKILAVCGCWLRDGGRPSSSIDELSGGGDNELEAGGGGPEARLNVMVCRFDQTL